MLDCSQKYLRSPDSGAQRMTPDVFGYPLSFILEPPVFNIFTATEICTHVLDDSTEFGAEVNDFQRMFPTEADTLDQ